jgi:SAM-dependent methyltransferase
LRVIPTHNTFQGVRAVVYATDSSDAASEPNALELANALTGSSQRFGGVANTTSYVDRTAHRLDEFTKTVLEFPEARFAEFAALKEFSRLHNPQRLLEVPSDGLMLSAQFPLVRIDRGDFVGLYDSKSSPLDNLTTTNWSLGEFETNAYDGALALAPIHHASEAEKTAYLRACYRSLKIDGVICFGEVLHDSREAAFLDGFVSQHTHTGHQGDYPDRGLCNLLRSIGFVDVESAVIQCHWKFKSRAELSIFVTRLFGLKGVTDDQVLAAVSDQLGIVEDEESTMMCWSLIFFRGVK